MKKMMRLGLVLALFISTTLNAQDFGQVDSVVRNYPKSFSNPDDLAKIINHDFEREDEKARAIYTWIATNIAYDVKKYLSNTGERRVAFTYRTPQEKARKLRAYDLEIALNALRSRIAVCQGYANLFQTLCTLTGLESEVVTGTSKSHLTNIGKMPGDSDHAWNAVKIDNRWGLVDVTFGAGALDGRTNKFQFRFSDSYFLADPELFFLNHFPDDKKWLLSDKTEKDFAELPLYFRGYMSAPCTIITPEKGIISNTKSNKINFKIVDLDETDKIFYTFSNDNIAVPVDIRRNDNVAEFEVALSNRSRSFLTIFVNNKSLAAYRVQ